MPTIDLGKIKFTWRGDWNAAEAYENDDVVRHAGSVWMAVAPHEGAAPGVVPGEWDIMLDGVPELHNKGDMYTRDENGPARLPIGAAGQSLRVGLHGMPEWRANTQRPGTVAAKLPITLQGSAPARVSACINDQGEVLAWGFGGSYTNGTPTAVSTSVPMLVAVEGPKPVGGFTRLYVGPDVLYALDAVGNVWTAGRNDTGQLGHGDTLPRCALTRIEYFAERSIRIKEVWLPQFWSGGQDATINGSSYFTDMEGRVYTCGYNGQGQLGHGDTTGRTTPTRIQHLINVEQLVVTRQTYASVYARCGDGALYVWGYNSDKQLGIGDATPRDMPLEVNALRNVVHIAAAYDFALAVTADGRLHAAGSNASGQLGCDDVVERQNWTHVNRFSAFAVSAYATGVANAASSYVLDREKRLHVAGANAAGQLGIEHVSNSSIFQSINAPWQGNIQIFRCNNSENAHGIALIVDNDGQIWTCGQHNNGQLLRLPDASATPRRHSKFMYALHGLHPGVRFTDAVILGSGDRLHVLALTHDGRLLAGGHNNYGQLGIHAGSTANHAILGLVRI